MKFLLSFLFSLIIFSFPLFSQSNSQNNNIDTLQYKSGNFIIGELKLIKDESVQFFNREEGTNYEVKKTSIDFIKLYNGKIITFDENTESAPSLFESIVTGETEEETIRNTCLLVGGVTGVLVMLLILIGGVFQ
ncbi:MAG: hypothetical protein ACM3O3_02860 [Syntrophothermus sp.]